MPFGNPCWCSSKESNQVNPKEGIVSTTEIDLHIFPRRCSIPNCHHEINFLTSVIDAYQDCDKDILNIVKRFIKADVDEDTWLILDRKLAELIVKVVPESHSKYITVGRNNKPILYVKLSNVIYDCLKSVLLFYKRLSSDLNRLASN